LQHHFQRILHFQALRERIYASAHTGLLITDISRSLPQKSNVDESHESEYLEM